VLLDKIKFRKQRSSKAPTNEREILKNDGLLCKSKEVNIRLVDLAVILMCCVLGEIHCKVSDNTYGERRIKNLYIHLLSL